MDINCQNPIQMQKSQETKLFLLFDSGKRKACQSKSILLFSIIIILINFLTSLEAAFLIHEESIESTQAKNNGFDRPKDQVQNDPMNLMATTGSVGPEQLLPDRKSLFGRDSIDLDSITHIDCHLRNLDFCYAGLLGASSRMLPESDAELEARCDEMRVTTSCLTIYNQRCSSYKAFGAISPLLLADQYRTQFRPQQQMALSIEVPLDVDPTGVSNFSTKVNLTDFMNLCEPDAKKDTKNRLIRKRLFDMSKCLNARLPQLTPCLDDLKVSLQLFYEPSRMLPVRPSCCALSRFRNCATRALDNVCGLSSFEQLVNTLGQGSSSGSAVKLVEKICTNSAYNFDSDYCQETLPPSGTKISPRRASKASKLAKALDLLSFSSPNVAQLSTS